jgi:hypothetical protein
MLKAASGAMAADQSDALLLVADAGCTSLVPSSIVYGCECGRDRISFATFSALSDLAHPTREVLIKAIAATTIFII